MTLLVETPDEMINTVEDILTLSPTELEKKYGITIYDQRFKMDLHWIDCLTPVEITAADTQTITFRCSMDMDGSLLQHQKAIEAFKTAARTFCETLEHTPATEYRDVLSGKQDSVEYRHEYEMEYDTEHNSLKPVPNILSELADDNQ